MTKFATAIYFVFIFVFKDTPWSLVLDWKHTSLDQQQIGLCVAFLRCEEFDFSTNLLSHNMDAEFMIYHVSLSSGWEPRLRPSAGGLFVRMLRSQRQTAPRVLHQRCRQPTVLRLHPAGLTSQLSLLLTCQQSQKTGNAMALELHFWGRRKSLITLTETCKCVGYRLAYWETGGLEFETARSDSL